jgi:sterol desaturase/sphingolipid hydroxylase (fatty acid hydroxylase superfamily)
VRVIVHHDQAGGIEPGNRRASERSGDDSAADNAGHHAADDSGHHAADHSGHHAADHSGHHAGNDAPGDSGHHAGDDSGHHDAGDSPDDSGHHDADDSADGSAHDEGPGDEARLGRWGVVLNMTATATSTGRRPIAAARPIAWVGVLLVTSGAVWLGVLGTQALVRGGGFAHSLRVAQGQMVGPGLVGVVVAIFLAERMWPAVARPWLAPAHLVDAGYLLLFAVLIAPLVILVDTGFSVVIHRDADFLVLTRIAPVPRVLTVVVILIGMDGMNWLAHVANHRWAALWRLHALHHSQEDMSVFTTFRTHPLSHATYLPALVPALVLGANGTVPAAALIVYSCLVTLPHANLRWSFGPLGRVLVSPAYHRLHHAQTPIDGRAVVNFGFVLVCWDRLAGCAAYPSSVEPVGTGIFGRPVPVEQAFSRPALPFVLWSQLVQPFALRSATDSEP